MRLSAGCVWSGRWCGGARLRCRGGNVRCFRVGGPHGAAGRGRGLSSAAPVVHNSLSGRMEPLSPREEGVLRWYQCGPTVYDDAHLGHARAYVTFDIIHRLLSDRFGLDVQLAMGVTDVDDKILARAAERGEPPLELSRRYEEAFFRDMSDLGVRPPSTLLRVSEHIPEIVRYVSRLLERGTAYRAAGSNVYFSVAALERTCPYGALRHANFRPRDDGEAGGEADASAGKRDPQDFALWKELKPGEALGWDSPWGSGRPGWHVECSAMSHAVFGPSFDLHTGGVDLAFPHHTNEIAQSCAHGGFTRQDEWVPLWLHAGHLHIAGRKMSKSLKNFVTVREFLAEHSADELRMFCLLHRYSLGVEWSADRMRDAARCLQRVREFFEAARQVPALSSARWEAAEAQLQAARSACLREVDEALADDLNTAAAMAAVLELVRAANLYVGGGGRLNGALVRSVAATVAAQMQQFGVRSLSCADAGAGAGVADARDQSTVQEVAAVAVDFRRHVRDASLRHAKSPLAAEMLHLCDRVRDYALADAGVRVRDTAQQAGVAGASGSWRLMTAEERVRRRRAQQSHPDPALDYFRSGEYAGKYSEFDAVGIPVRMSDGSPVGEEERARLRSRVAKVARAHVSRLDSDP